MKLAYAVIVASLGALWRDRGESVAHFRRRMSDPVQNVSVAHRIYVARGWRDWGGCT